MDELEIYLKINRDLDTELRFQLYLNCYRGISYPLRSQLRIIRSQRFFPIRTELMIAIKEKLEL